jgi:peptidoglycan hydrolase-like protein with peptidoglycan-binding domain
MSPSSFYILGERGQHLPATGDEHDAWYEDHDRDAVVGQWGYGANPEIKGFAVEVCTHFHGVALTHSSPTGLPYLYSTIVLGGVYDNEEVSYTDWEAARLGHTFILFKVKETLGLNTGPTSIDDTTVPSPASRALSPSSVTMLPWSGS